MDKADFLINFVFPAIMAISAAALGFLFRRTDKLHSETIRQDERIQHQGREIQEAKARFDKIDQTLQELPDKIIERIRKEK